jgi:hypothetical protein
MIKIRFYGYLVIIFSIGINIFSLDNTLSGTASVNSVYYSCNPDSVFYQQEDKGYYIENYLLSNIKINIGKDLPVSGVLDFNIKLNGLFISDTDLMSQSLLSIINEAYLSIHLSENLRFDFGKKYIKWGSSFTRNPTDFVNLSHKTIELEDFNDKEGVYCISGGLTFPNFGIDQFIILYDNLKDLGYGTKIVTYSLIPHTDLSFVFYYSSNLLFNVGTFFETLPFDEVEGLNNLAFYGEAGFSQKSGISIIAYNPSIPDYELVQRPINYSFYKNLSFGVRYTIPAINVLLLAEYNYLDDGYQKDEFESIVSNNKVSDLKIIFGNMFMHNLFFMIHKENLTENLNNFTDTLSLSLNWCLNPIDMSNSIIVVIESKIIDNCLFTIENGYYIGQLNTEYRLLPVNFFVNFKIKMFY